MVASVKITAEMQAPSGSVALELIPLDDEITPKPLDLGNSLQKIVQFDLKEEGNHVLAVSLSYSETTMSQDRSASSGRVRTFRKLYQFVAQPCLSVRTKVSEIPKAKTDGHGQDRHVSRFALEAQLENMADGSISLESVYFNPKPPFKSTSLNWDLEDIDRPDVGTPVLVPRDVMQVAFAIERGPNDKIEAQQETKDGRTVLGQLSMQWRTAFGDRGSLNTGWLMTKRR